MCFSSAASHCPLAVPQDIVPYLADEAGDGNGSCRPIGHGGSSSFIEGFGPNSNPKEINHHWEEIKTAIHTSQGMNITPSEKGKSQIPRRRWRSHAPSATMYMGTYTVSKVLECRSVAALCCLKPSVLQK